MKLLLWEEFRKILERINPLSPPSAPVQRRLPISFRRSAKKSKTFRKTVSS